MSERPKAFHMAFDTERYPGKIVVVEVTLHEIITADPKKKFRLDLCDHPLYPKLVEYVRMNPGSTRA